MTTLTRAAWLCATKPLDFSARRDEESGMWKGQAFVRGERGPVVTTLHVFPSERAAEAVVRLVADELAERWHRKGGFG